MSTPPKAPPEAAPPPAPAPEPVAAPAPAVPETPKPILTRIFGLSWGEGLRLLGLSTLVGFFVLAFDIAPTGTTLDVGGAFTAIVQRAFTAIRWAFESFWKPALAGALVVLPVWALWRLVRWPFRKKS